MIHFINLFEFIIIEESELEPKSADPDNAEKADEVKVKEPEEICDKKSEDQSNIDPSN